MSKEKQCIFLTQCDTTAGLLSGDYTRLNAIKGRPINQPILIESSSLAMLKNLARVPKRHKNRIRKAHSSTFIYPNGRAIRLIHKERSPLHWEFLKDFGFLYSTSANPSKQGFNQQWAEEVCDVMVYDSRGVSEGTSSKIYKINQSKIQRRR